MQYSYWLKVFVGAVGGRLIAGSAGRQDSRTRFCRALECGAVMPLRHTCQAAGGGVSGLRYDQGYSTETATVTRLRPAPLEA